jgi:hypothetical protein
LQNVGENHASGLPHIGLDCWSPNIGVVRDPRWGRNLETPSEDPAVCGAFGEAITKGLQRSPLDDRYVQAVVTLKHFDGEHCPSCCVRREWWVGSRAVGLCVCVRVHGVALVLVRVRARP